MTNKLVTIAILVIGCALSVSAERLYILYDATCMDRVEYNLTQPQGKTDYITYHINLQPGSKLILEVGEEGKDEQNYVPEGYLSCQTGTFDEQLMRRINANIDEVFVIYQRGNQRFTISPVTLAASYTKQGPLLTYNSPKYRFRFNMDNAVIGENITYDSPGVNLYFEGREDNVCQGNYLFRQLAPQSAYPVIDFKFVPEIGVIEERIGGSGGIGAVTSLMFDDINEVKMERYLREHCGQEPGTSGALTGVLPATAGGLQPQPAEYGNPGTTPTTTAANPPAGMLLPPGAQLGTVPAATTPVSPATPMPAPTTTSPAAPVAAAGGAATTHTVERGETLYGISRQYGVSVGQLQEWNNLGSTAIRTGQQLRVSAPTMGSSAPALPGSNVLLANRNSIANSNPGAATPVPYESGTAPNPNENTHIVKAGETPASLALKYGYTESRFREMNDMGSNDVIKVGQRLKTTDCICPEVGLLNQPATSTGTVRPRPYDPALDTRPAPATVAPSTLPQPTAASGQPLATGQSGQPNFGPQPTTTYSATPYPASAYPNTTTPAAPTNYDYPPANYSATASGAPAGTGYPAAGAPAYQPANDNRYTNEPEFGSIIPDDYSTRPATGMSGLETGRPIGTTTGAYGQPVGASTNDYRGYGSPTNSGQVYNPNTYDDRGYGTGSYQAPPPNTGTYPAQQPNNYNSGYGTPSGQPAEYNNPNYSNPNAAYSNPAYNNNAGYQPGYNSPTYSNPATAPTGNNRRIHIVQDGETVYSIARMYNISQQQLQQANGLRNGEVVIPYQRLYID